MGTIRDEKIALNSGEIHYLEAGDPENQTVLLLHGMSFTAGTWQKLGTIDLLAGSGYHAVALEMPGFGGSPASGAAPGTVLQEFLTQKGIDKPVLVGPSMGGQIGLEFCLDYQDLIGGLIVIGPVGVAKNAARLSAITIPTLAIWGAEDTISPPEHAKIIEKEIQGAQIVIFPGAPHPCYLEKTEEWHKVLLSFLGSKF